MKTRILFKSVATAAAGCLLTGLVAATAGAAEDGKALYDKNCASCHGPGGKGDGPAAKILKPAPKDLATAIKGKSDDDIVKVSKEGGKAVGMAATMPASKLSVDQIKAVVQYMKGFGQ
ncbi:MAG: cytochrome c [Deltaproteobacteria bacterium]|nr:cytochrome c [Deltaproteobacteria bacterium]